MSYRCKVCKAVTMMENQHSGCFPPEADEIISDLRKALIEIRDKWVPALRRDANEGDKTLCHAGGIAFLLAHVVPECDYPVRELKS